MKSPAESSLVATEPNVWVRLGAAGGGSISSIWQQTVDPDPPPRPPPSRIPPFVPPNPTPQRIQPEAASWKHPPSKKNTTSE